MLRNGLFADQLLWVTGGGSGIGRCVAHELASLGATVVISGRSADKLARVAAEIAEDGGRCETLAFDIRDEDAVKAGVAQVVAAAGARSVHVAADFAPYGQRRDALVEAAVDGVVAVDGTTRGGKGAVTEQVHDKNFRVSGSGFWQVHPLAAATLVDAVLAGAQAHKGDVVADLYAGVGLFTAFLADIVGENGTVVSVESDQRSARDARRNLHGSPQVRLIDTTVERALREGLVRVQTDIVVLDPPRTGAKKLVPAIVALNQSGGSDHRPVTSSHTVLSLSLIHISEPTRPY